jgi:ABC-type glycerol-3-phosphate transport system substrate-binding protein
MKKFISTCLLASMILLLIAGCSSKNEETTVRVWFGREDFIPGDRFERFHKDNPNIKVVFDVVPLEQAVQDYLRNYNAGNAPDMIQVFHDNIGTLAAQDSLLDMTSYIEDWKKNNSDSYNNILPQAWDMASFDGIPYGMAAHVGPYWHVYRKDIFEANNLNPPETWDEVIEYAKLLTDSEEEFYGYALVGGRAHPPWWMLSTFMSMGGEHTETGLPVIDSEAGIYLLNFYQQLQKDGSINPESISWSSGEMRGAFIGGNAAMAPIGDNIFPKVHEAMEYGGKWDATIQPYRPGAEAQRKNELWGWPMVVNKKTEHPEAIAKVLEYLIDTDIAKEVAYRYQPTTNKEVMQSEEYAEQKPWAPKFTEALSNTVIMPYHVRQAEVSNILVDAMQEALTNPDADASEMAARYQKLLNALDN